MMKLLIHFVAVALLISCSKNETQEMIIKEKTVEPRKSVFEDDFENGLKDFWVLELTDSSRYELVPDPLNSQNKVLRMELLNEDYVSGGKRSELLIWTKDSLGYVANYSFRFMLPESFFIRDQNSEMIIIHQWHDSPDPGFNWRTQNKFTQPPVYLFIDKTENDIYNLVFKNGLSTGEMDETISLVWKEELVPNKWYTFSCEVHWHIYSNKAYSIPKLNDEYFYTKQVKGETENKVYRRNMYNSLANYPKIGVYRFGNLERNYFMYFDDFKLETRAPAK